MTEQKYNVGNGHEISVEYDENRIAKITKEYLEFLIKGMNAWEEVLQELEHRYNGDDETVGTFNIGIKECIDIINQKLEGVTE